MTSRIERAIGLLANSEFEGRTLHPAQARAIVHALDRAGHLRAEQIERGKYRNTLGAELTVTEPYGIFDRRSLGDTWVAEFPDELFGGVDLKVVTPHSLRDCGYTLVEPAAEDEE